MSSGDAVPKSVKEGDLQLVTVPERRKPALPPLPLAPRATSTAASNAIVEYKDSAPKDPNKEAEELEVKLRRIIDNVPVRVNNTSGSSAGSGSGDFHQYRQMRRKEQDRLARMDVHFQKEKEVEEFNLRRLERMKAAEERTAKKRLKRQKKKQRKKEKKTTVDSSGQEQQKENSSEDDDESDDGMGKEMT